MRVWLTVNLIFVERCGYSVALADDDLNKMERLPVEAFPSCSCDLLRRLCMGGSMLVLPTSVECSVCMSLYL